MVTKSSATAPYWLAYCDTEAPKRPWSQNKLAPTAPPLTLLPELQITRLVTPVRSHFKSKGTAASPLKRRKPSTCTAQRSLPHSTMPAPLRSWLPVAALRSKRPSIALPGSMGCCGMRLSITLTTPPTALPPYSKAPGPRSTSMRSTLKGSWATAWSGLRPERSCEAPPLLSMRMRSPSKPRMMGRPALGPK